MIQIIKAAEREPSTSEKLSQGLGRGLELARQLYDVDQQKKQRALADAEIAEQYGVNLTGMSPDERKIILQETLRGKNQSGLENQRLQGKQQLLQGKQDFLGQILGKKGQEKGQNQQETLENSEPFDVSTLSDADIAQVAAVDPNMARALSHAKDVKLRETREERNFQERQKEKSPEYQREKELTQSQAKADAEYNKKLQESTKRTVLKRESLERLKAMNKKGVTGKPYEKLLERAGLTALTSEGRREFAAEVKNQYTDFKDIAGSQLTGMEFQTLTNAYPSPDFSREANEAIIKNLEIVQDTLNEEHKIANRLKKAYGKTPEDFQGKVNEQLEEYVRSRSGEMRNNIRLIQNEQLGIPKGHTLMLTPDGEELSVPIDQIDHYKELGAHLP